MGSINQSIKSINQPTNQSINFHLFTSNWMTQSLQTMVSL